MKKLGIIVLAIAALCVLALGTARAAGNSITITLDAQNSSGETGTATLTDMGNGSTHVVVAMTGGESMANPQPIHIHTGTCATLNPKPTYPLTNVVNGASDTTVQVSLSDLTSEAYAINVHKSATEAGTYVSCGNITAMTTGATTMPPTGNGSTYLLAGLLLLAAVVLGGSGLVLRRTRA